MTSIYWDIVAKPKRKQQSVTKQDNSEMKTDSMNNLVRKVWPKNNVEYAAGGDADGEEGTGKEKERGTWASKAEFLLSCVGFAVGLGNVWRFPSKCYKNGGGAFLIPYMLCLAACGLPMMVMELSFGQFCSQGTIGAWKISPIFRGMGWAMVIVVTLVGIYYNVVISYIMFYFFSSFTSHLPWSSCDNWWNTDNCFVPGHYNETATNSTTLTPFLDSNSTSLSTATESIYYNGSDLFQYANDSSLLYTNESYGLVSQLINMSQPKSSSEEYWERYVLQISSGLGESGSVRWQLALLLLASWIIIFLCLFKGVKSSGKVVYVTATFPYIILFILLIRGATLPGAGTGILYFITPRLEKLLDATVWFDAALQIFYSLCPGSGALIMLGSYNKFNNNCLRDGIAVSLINCATSVLCGFVVFSVIGFMSHELGVSPDQVVTDGPGLAFITFSTAISKMPAAPLWAVLFFLMLFTVGLDSQFVAIEVVTSGVSDVFPGVIRKHKTLFTLAVCFVLFLLGLPMVTNGGIYLLHLVDSYAAGLSLLILAFMECIILNWIYGQQRFADDIHYMLGIRPNLYLRLCWKYISPVVIMAIFIFCLVMHSPLTYGSYVYPAWSNSLGWCIAAFSLIMIPLFAAWELFTKPAVIKEVKASVAPSSAWGPYLQENRDTWIQQQREKQIQAEEQISQPVDTMATDVSEISHANGFSTQNSVLSASNSMDIITEEDELTEMCE